MDHVTRKSIFSFWCSSMNLTRKQSEKYFTLENNLGKIIIWNNGINNETFKWLSSSVYLLKKIQFQSCCCDARLPPLQLDEWTKLFTLNPFLFIVSVWIGSHVTSSEMQANIYSRPSSTSARDKYLRDKTTDVGQFLMNEQREKGWPEIFGVIEPSLCLWYLFIAEVVSKLFESFKRNLVEIFLKLYLLEQFNFEITNVWSEMKYSTNILSSRFDFNLFTFIKCGWKWWRIWCEF